MLTQVNPKLPMRSKSVTKEFYTQQLGFTDSSAADYENYLIVEKDKVQLHFFSHPTLNPTENYGQIYIRTDDVVSLYETLKSRNVAIHPGGQLKIQPWGQKEFSVLDPDHNLLTFGQEV
ncbi:MAG: VOC family protein [Bacteroidetes bacterium]|nr:VOC family protein [Bacteroidota bacterium]